MIIEVGKWKTRDGRWVDVTDADPEVGRYCVIGELSTGGVGRWTIEGAYDFGRISTLDLISPWEDSQTKEAAKSPLTPHGVAFGLGEISLQIKGWLEFNEAEYRNDGLSVNDDTFIVTPPVWPTRLQLQRWIEAFDAAVEIIEPTSQTQIKSESKMDVKVGDRVLVEAKVVDVVPEGAVGENHSIRVALSSGHIWLHRHEIKSVEPAPPAVGDTVTWGEPGSGDRLIEGFGSDWVLTRAASPNSSMCNKLFCWEMSLSAFASKSGFRVIKRAGER